MTKELKKENAELKSQLESERDLSAIAYQQGAESYKRKADIQLTKAKKILKKVVTDFHNMDCVTVHINKTIAEAEQFLSEVEK